MTRIKKVLGKTMLFYGLLAAFFLPYGAGAQETDHWVISKAAYDCIVETLPAYLAKSSDPIVIIVDACPEVDLTRALGAVTEATGGFNIGEGDRVLVMLKSELRCLDRAGNISDGKVFIPKRINC